MQGKELKLRSVLEGTKQFVIPAYQRSYAWREKQWRGLWKAMARQSEALHEERSLRPYFCGSLVLHQHDSGSADVNKFDVIDGQQRLTTILIALSALRDITSDARVKDTIDENILRNKFADGDDRMKLLPKATDGTDLKTIVLNGNPGTGRIELAHEWFKHEIAAFADERDVTHADILKGVLDGLLVVEITATEGDNPHRIFQTLNSTGVGLSEVDKLRSHFFMLLPTKHEKAYEEVWMPMDVRLGNSFQRFLHVDLISRGADDTATHDVYDRWQLRLVEVEDDEVRVLEELIDLAKRASHFSTLTDPPPGHVLFKQLVRLNGWGSNIHQPVSYQIVRLHDAGVLTTADATRALRTIESFVVRRMLNGTPTNNLNRIFSTTAGQLAKAKGDYADRLIASLSEKGKYWPTGEELILTLPDLDFATAQRSTQRHFVLRRIEEKLSTDGHPDWSSANFTLEHFMPQNLTQAWRKLLMKLGADDPAEVHRGLVHKIGNLTLTSLNPKLSDSPVKRKVEILGNSNLELHKTLLASGTWGPDEIAERSKYLTQVALSIWEGPIELASAEEDVAQSEIDRALDSLTTGEWTTLMDLVDLSGLDKQAVLEHLASGAADARFNILTPRGELDQDVLELSTEKAYRDQLVASGVFESTEQESASISMVIPASDLEARINAA